ncbi:probable flap endonuclease 1 homolog isoform X2 [Hypanus sabinus]|uniref:probable flap endonuclease 1 homolog isoform X2 n=1 Tax=Hypanus sabinus TaxID=79690 RepID=UPI0028C4A119|nr:probable flap endonuclease 1 homolog isoform X2 [Hypanus sabinus]
MGISRLSELIREQAAEAVTDKTIHAYEGRVMALDAAVVMNQFRMARPDKRYLHHLSQIVGVFYRTASLLEKGIKPVFVFDGPAPRMKSRVLRKRLGWRPTLENEEHTCRPAPESKDHACGSSPEREEHTCTTAPESEEHACTAAPESEGYLCLTTMERGEHTWRPIPGGCRLATESEGCVRRPSGEKDGQACGPSPNSQEQDCKVAETAEPVARTGRRDCQRLLTLLGVPYIEAPAEAEATCAALVKSGKVHCTATEDMDALPFGCTRLVRNVSAKKDARVEEFSLPDILKALNLTQEQFVDLCILMGCDYCEKIRGVGLKRALPLIQTHKSIEGIVQNLDARRFPAPEDWPYQEARTLFLQPEVADPHDVVLEWGEPDEEGLVQLLVHEKKAKEKRVRDRIRRLRESLRDVERRSRMFTAEKQRRLDEFYRKVRGLRYCRQRRPSSGNHFTNNSAQILMSSFRAEPVYLALYSSPPICPYPHRRTN